MKQKYFICNHCGNIITMIKDMNVPVSCCGEEMVEIIPGTTDAATEKHVPVYSIKDNKVTVTVGEIPHPMTEEHYIECISLQTKLGYQIKFLKPSDEPKACFMISDDDEIESVYAYCNLHSLWKTQ